MTMTKTAHLTAKQLELLRVITGRNADGSHRDLDQILESIRYTTSKASLQFSLRVLIKRGMVEKLETEHRRGSKRRPIAATELGAGFARAPRVTEPDDKDNIVELGGDDLSALLDVVPDFIAPAVL